MEKTDEFADRFTRYPESGDSIQSFNHIRKLITDVTKNYNTLAKEWTLLQEEIKQDAYSTKDVMTIHTDDLSKLATEVAQLKMNLPKVVNQNVISAASKVDKLEEEIKKLETSAEEATRDAAHWKSRCETATAECQREKEENLKLRHEVQELTQQVSQQSEYCSSLGAACCTLLWRVSRCEESIQSILVGTKVDDFLSLVSSTLHSYITAYKDDWPEENTDETQFILALCGIITNIAASAFGRDFLVTSNYGKQVVDTYVTVLVEAPNGKSSRLKNLILMSLYNISINQKGIKYISTRKGIMGILSWLLQEEKAVDNQLNTLRLIQSILCDNSNINVVHEIQEALPATVLQQLTRDKNREIKELAGELMMDIQQHLRSEQ